MFQLQEGCLSLCTNSPSPHTNTRRVTNRDKQLEEVNKVLFVSPSEKKPTISLCPPYPSPGFLSTSNHVQSFDHYMDLEIIVTDNY